LRHGALKKFAGEGCWSKFHPGAVILFSIVVKDVVAMTLFIRDRHLRRILQATAPAHSAKAADVF
jgi:hypothetical protein